MSEIILAIVIPYLFLNYLIHRAAYNKLGYCEEEQMVRIFMLGALIIPFPFSFLFHYMIKIFAEVTVWVIDTVDRITK